MGGLAVGRSASWSMLCAAVMWSARPADRPTTQDPWLILDRASQTFEGIQTLTADFVQVITNPMLGAPDTTRGRLYQQRPNQFAMRFSDPAGDRIVADGRYLWFYTPSTAPGQVIRSRIPVTGTTGPNLIGQFVEHPRERYHARFVRSDSAASGWVDVVALTPRDSTLPYSGAELWVSREDGLVRRLKIAEHNGQERAIQLRAVKVNVGVAAREFRFAPPAGVTVVNQ
jgi:outer membrane lipoprotein carrier protein